jgi:hypothetical protein
LVKEVYRSAGVAIRLSRRGQKVRVDPSGAQTVRSIFERYLVVESLPEPQRELRESGTLTRRRELATGKTIGGVVLTMPSLVPSQSVYLGELNHRAGKFDYEDRFALTASAPNQSLRFLPSSVHAGTGDISGH